MSREESINLIKAACVKANSLLEGRNTSIQIPAPFSGIINFRDETIRLSDVLLVMGEKRKDMVVSPSFQKVGLACVVPAPNSNFKPPKPTYCYWNLKDDNLLNQSDETLEFLAKLLT